MSEENAGISICRRNVSQGSYSNIIFPLESASGSAFFVLKGERERVRHLEERTYALLKVWHRSLKDIRFPSISNPTFLQLQQLREGKKQKSFPICL